MALTQITSEGIKDGEVKNADMADDAIGVAELSATGTASSSTFLRGDNSWQAISGATDSTKMPLAGGTFTGDVTWDSATNAGRDMVWDESESDLTFNDAAYIQMGDANDLSIGHNGTTSFIQNTSSKLTIGSGGNYTTELLYGNSKKFETTSGGISITGTLGVTDTITCQANIDVGDSTSANNGRLRLGGEEDIEIYHNGTDSYLKNATGHLYIHNDDTSKGIALLSDEYWINNEANTENMIHAVHDGAVSLYHNNVNVFSTMSTGAQVKTGDSTSYITMTTSAGDAGFLYANSNTDITIMDGQGHSMFKGIKDGAAELYYDNSKKFETFSAGCKIYSDLSIRGAEGGDAVLGLVSDEGDDNADNWRLVSAASDNKLSIQNYAGGAWENSIVGAGNGAVELYADNVKKLQTNSSFGTILSNTTDDANYTNVLTLARRGYETSGYGVNFKAKGGSAASQNGVLIQVSQGSGGYSDRFTFDNDGLKFGSDTAAANAISDYEEGTWTPTFYFTSGTGTFGYEQQYGAYTKIGNRVLFTVICRSNSHSGTSSGSLQISGLPWAVDTNNTPDGGSCFFILGGNFDTNYGVSTQLNSSERIEFYKQMQSTGQNYSDVSASECGLSVLFVKVSGQYITP